MALASNCPICNSRRRFLYLWQGYQVFQCEHCGTQSASPQPDEAELARYYQRFNMRDTDRWQVRLELVRRGFAGHLRRYRKHTGRPQPTRFIDLGGGVGYWVRAALQEGVEAWLLDCDVDAIAFARDALAISHTVQGDAQRCAEYFPRESFDFVFARHVIEHVRDPDAFLRNIASVMLKGGLLEIETPNITSWEQLGHPGVMRANYRIVREGNAEMSFAAAAGHALVKSMSGVNPPKHLWGFAPNSLRLLLKRNGFEVLAVRQAVAGDTVFDPLYYDLQRHSAARHPSVAYRMWERLSSVFFARLGTNLCVLARRQG